MRADWQDTATAIGTVAVAVVAVGVALFAEWRADIRVKREREHSAKGLAEERAAADTRLMRQMEHSDAQLREDRQRTRKAEQQAEAWAVQIIPNLACGGDGTSQLTATVRNLGNYSIVQVEVQFSPDGENLVSQRKNERLDEFEFSGSGFSREPPARVADFTQSGYQGILTRGAAMRFWSDDIADSHLSGPFSVVRWRDHLGQLWEHRLGRVRMVAEGQPWTVQTPHEET